MADAYISDNSQRQVSKDTIQAWLVTQIADLMAVDGSTVDVQAPFTEFGISSRDAILLSGDLEDWLNRRLSPTLLYEYPTIDALADYLSRDSTKGPAQAVAQPAAHTNIPLTPSVSSSLTAEQVAQLSDEEAERLLLEKLNKISPTS